MVRQEQPPPGPQHPGHLGQDLPVVGHPAQHEGAHHGVEGSVAKRQVTGVGGLQARRPTEGGGPADGLGEHPGAPLDPRQGHVRRVVRQVESGADGHLEGVAGGLTAHPGSGVAEEVPVREAHAPVVRRRLPVPGSPKPRVSPRTRRWSVHDTSIPFPSRA